MTKTAGKQMMLPAIFSLGWLLLIPMSVWPQTQQESAAKETKTMSAETLRRASDPAGAFHAETDEGLKTGVPGDYRIGAQDMLEVSVFEAPELNRSLRVAAGGEISMPLIGSVQAAGLTARELEKSLEEKYREYIKNPQVGVLVSSIQSHPVSVLGAVKNPGTFQLQEPTTLLQILSKAGGLAEDAGDQVLVMRGSASNEESKPSTHAAASDKPSFEVNLRNLMDSGNPEYNLAVYPGDIITVSRAGIVYVVGGVNRPGGFVMKSNEKMTVLKAVALAEGLKGTAAKGRALIIRTDGDTGSRKEIPINLGKMLNGKTPDAPLEAADILFVPNSAGKSALLKGAEAAIQTASGVIIWHRYQ